MSDLCSSKIAGLIKHLLEVERQIMSSWSLDPPFTIRATSDDTDGSRHFGGQGFHKQDSPSGSWSAAAHGSLGPWKFIENIAKGTTDPRVEFISQVQTKILIKFHLQNLDQASTSKSQPNISLSIKLKLQNLDQT